MAGLSKKILGVDISLYRIAKRLNVLYHINPINSSLEKKRFLKFYRRGIKYIPQFKYRRLKLDVKGLIKSLKPLETKLGSSEIETLYKTKIDEIHTALLLVSAVGDRDRFFGYSIRLYGTPLDSHGGGVKPLDIAKTWLEAQRFQEDKFIPAKASDVHKESVEKALQREARYYGFKCKIQVKDHLSANAAAGESSVALRATNLYSRKEVIRICVHEVGFHVLTTHNAKQHKLRIFEIGTPGYLTDQEGGAIWAEEESKVITNYRLAILGARTMGIYLAVSGADFWEVFSIMHGKYGFSSDDAFYICERVYRGGLFTKDAIYQLGFYRVLNHFRFDIFNPYTFISGKMSLEYIPLAEELMRQGYVQKPKYIPRFLQDEEWINTWQTLSFTHNLFKKEKYLADNRGQ